MEQPNITPLDIELAKAGQVVYFPSDEDRQWMLWQRGDDIQLTPLGNERTITVDHVPGEGDAT